MKNRWPELLGLVMLIAFFVSGCTLLDSFFGVQMGPDGKPVSVGGGVAGTVGGIGSLWIPWLTTALSGAGNIYLELRRRNWKGAAVSTVTGLEEFFATPEGSAIKTKLLEKLGPKHDAAKAHALIEAVLSGKIPL